MTRSLFSLLMPSLLMPSLLVPSLLMPSFLVPSFLPALPALPVLPLLMVTSGVLVGCTDPVEEAGSSGSTESVAQGSAARPRATRETEEDSAAQAERERARTERAAQARRAESLAADVAAGLEDGGVPDSPSVQDPPEAAPAADADADGDAPTTAGSTEPSAFIRPVIHADVIENFTILRFALAEDVIEREPVMISSRFRRNSGPMHVFMEVRNLSAEDVTLIVGFRPASIDRRGGGVSLTVPPAPRYRTRARGNTRRAAGEWVCEVMDEHQRVLVTQRFFIVEEAPSPTESAN